MGLNNNRKISKITFSVEVARLCKVIGFLIKKYQIQHCLMYKFVDIVDVVRCVLFNVLSLVEACYTLDQFSCSLTMIMIASLSLVKIVLALFKIANRYNKGSLYTPFLSLLYIMTQKLSEILNLYQPRTKLLRIMFVITKQFKIFFLKSFLPDAFTCITLC